MKRLRPPFYTALALWMACSEPLSAQEEFYIELRGPESSSPAEASPQPAPATTPAQASPGRYGPIRSTDTLWSIAARHTRSPVTVQQTMVALYHLNPNAFVRGNINYLQRGASLRLPTQSQARQRSAREAEAEFRRLSQQGNRRVTRAATAPRPAPAAARPAPSEPVVSPPRPAPAPVVASAPQPAAAPAAGAAVSSTGLSQPKAAAPVAVAPVVQPVPAAEATSPAEAEETALARLQTQLLDELREQVAMSNEQLAELANNNQALRQRLSQLTAEVGELKMAGATGPAAAPANTGTGLGGWLDDLLTNPLNLALVLTLPALLLLALFTLWWRSRVKRELAEQEKELSESASALMDDERNEFDELFGAELTPRDDGAPAGPEPAERDIDEDAFARFLEEQQLQEEQEALRQQAPASEPDPASEPEAEEAVAEEAVDFDNMLFDDETLGEPKGGVSNDEIDELMFDAVDTTAPTEPAPEPEPYVSVDRLMAEAERGESPEWDSERKLDVGLDDYADVLGQGRDVDIDFDEGGMGAKLDLARAYIEIEDLDSARDLLNEALEQGNEEQKADAEKLLQRLAKR
ncbi:hypothetical protein C7H85_01760 [Zobellella endophytica]|uniref:Pilus assembly protein FimV n=1 Tax=Zobellella endophytica TaxID=2116700 RepID=A0A2P7RBG3_9GAMM|nr:FimV/HubP family polar landmark protein [Zobellella endophytica]PSJ47584.1 hypothetical protein C7H85_01760 [Zobellella endophytica]